MSFVSFFVSRFVVLRFSSLTAEVNGDDDGGDARSQDDEHDGSRQDVDRSAVVSHFCRTSATSIRERFQSQILHSLVASIEL